MVNEEVTMTMSVLPGAMTGISTLMAGMVSINNVFMDMTRQIDSTFGLVDATVITTGTVIAQFGLKAAEAFGEFEQGMKIVQMVSGQTRDDIAQLSQAANQFSVQYRMDINQITEGLQTLGRAGLNSASEQSEVLQNGLNTAKLEGRELNSVLEELIQNTALLGGDLKSPNFGEDSGYINDLLVATSMTAPITTHDVSETLKYSGGIAAAAGAKIRTDSGDVNEQGKAILEDYMGAIAAFAQKGVTGSIAGTALRAFFNKPATQDSSVTEALASIKLKPEYLWEDDEETMKPVSQQIEIIQKQMDKLEVSTMDRLQIWSKIVGGKMGQQMMKLESDDIKELTKDIRAADDASSLAAGSMQTFQANMKEMSEQGQVAFREFGSRVAAFLNPFIDVVTKILEMLSNPAVSAALFGGFLLAMGKVYSAIRKVLSGLKKEFSDFMNYFRSGETLMAIKPSTERGLKRKGQYTDYKNTKASNEITTVKDLVESYKRASQADRLKYLREELGLSDSQIAARDITGKWTSDKLVTGTPDNKIMQHLIDNNKLTDEAFNDIFILSADEWRKKHEKSIKEVNESTKKSESTKRNIENYNKRREENEKKWKEENASQGNIGSRNKGPDDVSDENWYNRPIPGVMSKDALNYQDEYFKNIKDNANFSNIKIIDETRTGSGILADQTIGASYVGKEIEDLDKKMEELRRNTIPTSEEVEIFDTTVENTARAAEEASAAMTKFNQKILDFFIKDAGLSFTENGYGVPLVDEEGLHGKKGVRYGTKAARIPPVVRAILANPGEDVDLNNLPAYDVQKDMDDYLAKHDLDDKGKEVLKSYLGTTHLTGTSQKFFDKKMEELDAYLNPRFNSAAEIKNSGFRINDINEYIKETYGKDLKLPRNWAKASEIAFPYMMDWSKTGNQKGGIKNNDFIAFANSLGVDVSGAKNRNEMIDQLNAHLKYGAYTTDQKIGEAQVRAAAVNAEGLEKQIELEEQQNQFAQEYINLLNEQKRKLDENIAKMQKILELEERKAISMKGTGGDTTYKYGEDVRKESDAFRRRRDMKEYSDMTTSSSDQVHKTSKEPDYSKVGKGAGASYYTNKDKDLVFIDGKWQIIDLNSHPIVSSQHRPSGPKYDITKGRDMSTSEEYAAWGLEYHPSFRERLSNLSPNISNPFSGLKDRISNSLFSSATDGFFRTKGTAKTLTRTQKLGNAFSNLSNLVGGPLMIAMEAFTLVVNYVQNLYQEYTQELKNAKDAVKDAYSERQQAEDSMRQLYREQNPNADSEAASDYVLEQYGAMYDSLKKNDDNFSKWIEATSHKSSLPKQYETDSEADDGSMKEKEEEEKTEDQQLTDAVNENSYALYQATAQLELANSKLTSKMQDGMWGTDGLSSEFSDSLGEAQDTWFGFVEGSGSIENGFLKTASQKDENYAGYTELAGLMLEDFKDANGEWQDGLKKIYGSDFKDVTSTMNSKAKGAMKSMATFANSLGPGKNARLQSSMMNDKKSWQKLAKEMAKYEKKTGKHAMAQETTNKRMENLIKKLQIDTHLSRAQVIAAAQLQQLQDMYEVAEQTFVPLMSDQAATAARLYDTTAGSVDPGTQQAAGGAVSTAANAAQIAAYLSVMAQNAAVEAAYNEDLIAGRTSAKSKEEYLQEAAGTKIQIGTTFHKPAGMSDEDWSWSQLGISDGQFVGYSGTVGGDIEKQKRIAHALEYQGDRLRNPNWTDQQVADYSKRIDRLIDQGMSFEEAMKRARENYAGASAGLIEAAYLSSGVGEEDSGSGGSGSGSGSGSDNKDKGTKKERVDLVLCNKKEIPKLNVNLFKKPPTFTVLNKNFKVRDVKINTEDTPKAIMSSIKNAFIDVQKRSDPKIIQDEEAEYDPVAATDGNAVPSGSSKSGTS